MVGWSRYNVRDGSIMTEKKTDKKEVCLWASGDAKQERCLSVGEMFWM